MSDQNTLSERRERLAKSCPRGHDLVSADDECEEAIDCPGCADMSWSYRATCKRCGATGKVRCEDVRE